MRAARAGALTLEQGRQDLDHRRLPAGREVGDLHGREGRSGVGEHAGVAEVVEVVARVMCSRRLPCRSR